GKGCFVYGIGKTGSRAIQRLPNLDPGACTKRSLEVMVRDTAQSVSDLSASVSLPKGSVSLNEPIYADLTIANPGGEERSVDLGLNGKSNIELTIRPRAASPRPTPFQEKALARRERSLWLQAPLTTRNC